MQVATRLNEYQVSEIIGLSVHSLRADRYRMQHRGEVTRSGPVRPPTLGIPFIKIGKRVVYDAAAVAEWQERTERVIVNAY